MERTKAYRTIVLVYVSAISPGAMEYASQGEQAGPDQQDQFHEEYISFPLAMQQLYPGRAETEFLPGSRLDFEAHKAPTRPESLQMFAEAIVHYEHAMSAGLRGEQNLIYHYALALIQTQVDPGDIDVAIARWRRDFPDSDLEGPGRLRP